jgi:hypothetical protein
MAFTESDLTKLEDAIKSGVKRVKFADREVEYQDLAAMLKARDLLRRELGLTSAKSGRQYASFAKGTD